MAGVILIFAAAFLVLSFKSLCRPAQSAPALVHPEAAAPCTDKAHRQFDFWVGDWDVVEIEHPTVIVAHARIEKILNECVLHEVYESPGGHKGESFSIYDATRNAWHQSWVTNSGQLLIIEGHLSGEAMILQGTDQLPDGKSRQVRGEWRVDKHGVHESAVRSIDAGVTWVSWFDLLFRPRTE